MDFAVKILRQTLSPDQTLADEMEVEGTLQVLNEKTIKAQRHGGWNWRKLKSMGSLGALGFIMLFQYQNCAPASGVSGLSSSKVNGGGTVTIIDNMNATAGLSFSQTNIQAPPSSAATVVDGACSLAQESSVLSWSVNNSSGSQMEEGQAVCSHGKFKVEMAPSNEMECGQSYLLQAEFGNSGSVAVAQVSRDCSADTVASSD